MPERILVVGDVHADFERLNAFISLARPRIILQCGDFGWWPHHHDITTTKKQYYFDQYALKMQETVLYWCDGNHENHWDLQYRLEAGKKPLEIPVPGCWYMPRGSVLELNGQKILFFGGGDSVDKKYRKIGKSWWPEEIPTEEDFQYAEEQIAAHGGKIDVVISHTAPSPFLDTFLHKIVDSKLYDPTIEFLDKILEKYRPKRWFFGHFHVFVEGEFQGCSWTCLADMRSADQWWSELPS